ncbi:hypothetical protein H5410_051539 [Solanum commersonii]|uniref:Uncharacterized protein n=1 Tax=Solanum commersonii TaxID=4109 RepID=A0A9J5X1A6_SOLCO|nr:hypothetical protein H5410_051539 [Solanum commersonii]
MNRCEYSSVVLLILSPKFLQDSRAFSGVLLELLDDVDLLEMLLISGNVGKCFVVSSRSPGRTPLITPSKNYVVDVAFSNCRMLVEETTTSFGHVASPCWSWMPSHCDTWHEFGLQGLTNLTTSVDIFVNAFSFFETSLRVGLPNLTTRVEVFMNALLRLQEYLFLVVVFYLGHYT